MSIVARASIFSRYCPGLVRRRYGYDHGALRVGAEGQVHRYGAALGHAVGCLGEADLHLRIVIVVDGHRRGCGGFRGHPVGERTAESEQHGLAVVVHGVLGGG